jgi:hypothetical protein
MIGLLTNLPWEQVAEVIIYFVTEAPMGMTCCWACTDKKEENFFLIYKEILNGAVAKSYVRKCANI